MKIARLVALAHIVVGILLLIFGIVDRVEGYFWTGEGCFGIWCGIWMIITGSVGIPASSRERNSSSQSFAGAFMGCSITSAVFGGVIIICYGISIAQYHYYDYWYDLNYWYNYDAEMAITAITLILGVVEFAIGILAAILCCYVTSCDCCGTSPEQTTSVVYVSNQGMVSGGYIMGQGPGGVPIAFPMQPAGGVVAVPVSSSGGVGVNPQLVQAPTGGVVHVPGQPPMYQVPASGGMGMQPQMVQVHPSGAPGGQVQMVQMPASGAHGPGQGQMFQVPSSGTVGGPHQMAQMPSGVEASGESQFVRVTPDGPEKGGQEPFV